MRLERIGHSLLVSISIIYQVARSLYQRVLCILSTVRGALSNPRFSSQSRVIVQMALHWSLLTLMTLPTSSGRWSIGAMAGHVRVIGPSIIAMPTYLFLRVWKASKAEAMTVSGCPIVRVEIAQNCN